VKSLTHLSHSRMEHDIEKLLEQFPANRKELLIPILQQIQQETGSLNSAILERVGQHLSIPSNKVYGVATFYDHFRFRARGTYHFQVCNGTSCHLFGNLTLLQELEKRLNVKAGQTSRDGRFSLELVQCLGACHHTPVVLLNGKPLRQLTPETLGRIIGSLEE
jgi:NADH:ubiquinone oxidoreductase subunit E